MNARVAMHAFGYGRDPWCLAACAAYAVNRWLVPVGFTGMIWRGHFSDLLLIPAALPWMLWMHRRLGWRQSDAPPAWREVGLHVVVWALAAEVVGPLLFARAVSDPWDVVAYAVGGAVAGWLWNRT